MATSTIVSIVVTVIATLLVVTGATWFARKQRAARRRDEAQIIRSEVSRERLMAQQREAPDELDERWSGVDSPDPDAGTPRGDDGRTSRDRPTTTN